MQSRGLSKEDSLKELIESAKLIDGNNIIFDYRNGQNQAWKWYDLLEHGWVAVEDSVTYFVDSETGKKIHFNSDDSLIVSPDGKGIAHLLYPTKEVFTYSKCVLLDSKNRVEGMERVTQTDHTKMYVGDDSVLVVFETSCYPYGVSRQWELHDKAGNLIRDGRSDHGDTFEGNWSLVVLRT